MDIFVFATQYKENHITIAESLKYCKNQIGIVIKLRAKEDDKDYRQGYNNQIDNINTRMADLVRQARENGFKAEAK